MVALTKHRLIYLCTVCACTLYACATPSATLSPESAQDTPAIAATIPAATETRPPAPSSTAAADITVRLDFTQPGHPISPLIYGMTGAPAEMMQELRLPLRSWGGNPQTRYNWKLGNAWNAARDFLYLNGDYGYQGESAANDFIRENMAAGAATRLTVPTLGWVAKDTSSCSFPGADDKCGMGDYATCDKPGPIADPRQTSVEAPPEFIGEWIDQLNADGLTVGYFAMDNEPELWGVTHYDVHPACSTYDEILQKFIDYARVVKAKAPQAEIMGPVTCCWYFYWNSMAGELDKLGHANMDFLTWFLQKMAAYEQESGQRLLDVLDIHYYPEGLYNDDTSPQLAAQRLRATRSLWDAEYKDESWIDTPIYLIPRMRELIAKYYPGTRLAITEWNFGAEETMNGALAIADALGIFGREQLDLAAYYRNPDAHSPGYFAFKIFTNYDDQGGRFGDISVPTISSDPANLPAFGAQDAASGRTTVLLVNKNPESGYRVRMMIDGPHPVAAGTIYRYDQSDLSRISSQPIAQADQPVLDLPPYSLTLVVLEPGK